jgi:hypothetical protein
MKTLKYAESYRRHSRSRPALSKHITKIISPKMYMLLRRPVRLSWAVVMSLCGTELILETKLPYKFVLWTPQEGRSAVTPAPPVKCVALVTTSAIRNVSLDLQALWRHHLRHTWYGNDRLCMWSRKYKLQRLANTLFPALHVPYSTLNCRFTEDSRTAFSFIQNTNGIYDEIAVSRDWLCVNVILQSINC